jgi:uncharacterized protein YoxC
MNDLTDYTLVTTIAVVLLTVAQLLFLVVVTIVGLKLLKVLKKANETVTMSKEFMSGLREQQLKSTSMFKLGLFAMKQLKKFKR